MRKSILKVGLILLLAVCCGVFGLRVNVSALKRALTLSPTSERIVLTSGETYRSGFSIVNPANADIDLNYLATIGPFTNAKGEGSVDDYGGADFDTISKMNEVMNWTTIDNPTGTVTPNERVTLSYTIKVPKDAPAGGQYMAIFVKEDPEKKVRPENGSSIAEVMQMAYIVYAEVAGDTKKEGVILENSVPSFLLDNKLEAGSRVRNNGNVHTDAEVVLQVWPLFSDEEICTNEEDASLSFVMPNTERYHVETCELPMVGIFRAKQTVKIFGETSVVERTILVCPLWLLFIIIFIIVGIIVWLVVRMRARKKAEATEN